MELDITQVRDLFDQASNGAFKTDCAHTKGVLYVDEAGKLQNNRKVSAKSATSVNGRQTELLRQALVDAFSKAGASSAFVSRARQALNLGEGGNRGVPLERRVVKQLVQEFDMEEDIRRNFVVVDSIATEEAISEMKADRTGDSGTFIESMFREAASRNASNVVISASDVDKALASMAAAGKPVSTSSVKAIASARAEAERTLRALEKFSGAELANSLKGGDLGNSPAGKAVAAAMEAQIALAECLRNCGGAVARLAERANRRAAELATLMGNLADAMEAEPQAQKLQKPVQIGKLAEIAVNDVQTRGVIACLEDMTGVRLADFESFTATDRDLTADDLTNFRHQLGVFRQAMTEARERGIDVRGDGALTRVDDEVFRALEKLMDRYAQRLDGKLETFFMKTLHRHVDAMKVPYENWWRKQPLDVQQDPEYKAYADLVAHMQDLRARLSICIETKNVADIDAIVAEVQKLDYNQICECEQALCTAAGASNDPEVKDMGANIPGFRTSIWGLAHVAENIRDRLTNRAEILSKLKVTGADCRSLLEDGLMVSDRLEARVFGYKDSIVDSGVSGRKPTDVRPLGSGAGSQTFLCTFAEEAGEVKPEQRVFKPESSGWNSLKQGVNSDFSTATDFQRTLDYNLATEATARQLGLGERCTKARLGHLNGEVGMFLDVAPGKAIADLQTEPKEKPEGALSGAEIKDLLKNSPEKRRKVRGEVARQLNQLQWLDLINAQLDRHLMNVFLKVTAEGEVEVTGIDNDDCMGEKVVGIGKYKASAGVYNALSDRIVHGIYRNDPEKAREVLDELSRKGIMVPQPDGTVMVDYPRLPGELKKKFGSASGIRSASVPTCMDMTVYEGILANSGENIGKYADSLDKMHLTQAQKDAAIARMQEARDIADQMWKDHKVYKTEQWQDEELQRTLFAPSPKDTMLEDDGKPESSDLTNIKDDYFRRTIVRVILET